MTTAQGASTLTEVLAAMEADGYTGQLIALRGARARCARCEATCEVAELEVADEARLEGASDPSDMALVLATSCPMCRTPSTLVVGYGPNASEADVDAIQALETPVPSDPG